jgi:hypothetical protein
MKGIVTSLVVLIGPDALVARLAATGSSCSARSGTMPTTTALEARVVRELIAAGRRQAVAFGAGQSL